MTNIYLTPEQGAELKKLYEEHARASGLAAMMLVNHGMSSDEFLKADAEAGRIWLQIRKLIGKEGQHWMS